MSFLQSAAVAVAAVLILVLVTVLIGILGTVLVLVIHSFFLQKSVAGFRYGSLPPDSGFILGLEKKTGSKSGSNGGCDSACSCA